VTWGGGGVYSGCHGALQCLAHCEAIATGHSRVWGQQQEILCSAESRLAASTKVGCWLLLLLLLFRAAGRYCGGTEIGGGFLAGNCLQPQSPSTFSSPTLGASLVLLLQDGQQTPHGSSPQSVTGYATGSAGRGLQAGRRRALIAPVVCILSLTQ
jgi:hypothetical protein